MSQQDGAAFFVRSFGCALFIFGGVFMWICKCGNKCELTDNFCCKCGSKKTAATSQNSDSWYYINNGTRTGPISFQEVQVAIQEGDISQDTLVWTKGMSTWCVAANTSLKSLFELSVPPLDKNSISDKWLWCLATIPLMVNLLLFQILRPITGSFEDYFISFAVFLLNCLFLILDSRYLQKTGHNLSKSMFLGFILVPVYLFIRSSKTNKHYWPGITWCIIEFLLLIPIW